MLISSPLLSGLPTVVHGFSTAVGGGATEPGQPMTPALQERLGAALGLPGADLAWLSQVHGRVVLEPGRGGLAGEGDALVSRSPGLLVAVRVADCVPILVAGRDGVAAIHAGWRGLAADIIGEAVARLGDPVAAAVGPCISADNYEVGPEVIVGIASAGVPHDVFVRRGPRREHADLRAAAAWQLRRAGVPLVDVLEPCTFADPRLHSHRRDGARSGRQLGIIGLRE